MIDEFKRSWRSKNENNLHRSDDNVHSSASCSTICHSWFLFLLSTFYYPQDSYVRQTDTWSINAELSAGFQDGRYGLTLSGNVPVRTDLRSLQRFSFDAYPTNWLVFSIGFSRTDFTEPGFTDPVETNSLGLMTGLAFEFALSEHLDIGVKGLHDFHGADIEEQYEWLGGTTASTYLKISF